MGRSRSRSRSRSPRHGHHRRHDSPRNSSYHHKGYDGVMKQHHRSRWGHHELDENKHERRRRDSKRTDKRHDNDEAMSREAGGRRGERIHEVWGKKDGSSVGDGDASIGENAEVTKEQPVYALSGALAKDTNTTTSGVVLKWTEPPEARKPKKKWRLYPFKGEQALDIVHIHSQSAFLIGRERLVADIPVDHPSCSKQHAVIQFRSVPTTNSQGLPVKRVKPYIMDLESTNGTFLNSTKIDAARYVELCERDCLKFGLSSREYIVLHDKTKNEREDVDDVIGESY